MSTASAGPQLAPNEPVPANPVTMPSFPSARVVWGTGLIAVLVMAIYYRVLGKLVIDWWQIPDDSHGFLVPIFAGYLVWTRRKEIWKTQIAPTWSGVPVVALGLATLILGNLGAELFLARFSFVILLTGFTICFGGWALLRQLRFPLLVLLIAIPIPAILLNKVTLPLQMFASKTASDILPLFGVPVLREGNVIDLPSMKLEVAEACSGIRSLVSLFAISLFYGYFALRSNLRRCVLILLSVPIAIAVNALRIVGTGLCVQYWDPEKALGFFHEFSGWIMFLISLACLLGAQRLLSFVWKERRHG